MPEEPAEQRDEADERLLDGLLWAALRRRKDGESGADDPFLRKTFSQIDGEIASEASRRTHVVWRTGGGLLAACLALLLVFYQASRLSRDSAVAVREANGEVFAKMPGEKKARQLFPGDLLRAGEEIFCPGESLLIADYPDGTSFELTDGKALVEPMRSRGSGKRLDLREGHALFSVAPQSSRSRMSFRTPQGGGEVLGTVFSLAVAANITTVRTFEGEVRVWSGEDQGRATKVEAGQSAYLGESVPLASESLNVSDLEPGEIAWVQEFHHRFAPGTNAEGNLVKLKEGERQVSVLESIPADESHHDTSFRPDQWLSLEFFGTDRAMFSVPEDMEVVVRIRAEKEGGHCLVALLPVDPEFRYEHSITKPVYLTSEWQDIILTAHQFQPYDDSRELVPGEKVRSVAVWGFEAGKIELDRILVRRGK